ncbi:MAG TPA: hypothetical protein VFV94_06775, partial [Polyangiaceae bacterium]|nr:hypothetical protein [Polyangiaceae bacterium]
MRSLEPGLLGGIGWGSLVMLMAGACSSGASHSATLGGTGGGFPDSGGSSSGGKGSAASSPGGEGNEGGAVGSAGESTGGSSVAGTGGKGVGAGLGC